nr:immunoglobulin light chain junction region [Macaca mulatta]
CLLYFIGARIF